MTQENYKKKWKKRLIISVFFSIICITIVIITLLKSNYFVIKEVVVQNNLFVTKQEISLLSELKGKNIFLINKNKAMQYILLNPYIEKISIKRKLPASVIINVTEKKIKGVIKYKNGLINIDGNGKMVQVVTHFPNGKIPMVLGVKVDQYLPNEYIIKNDPNKLLALKAALTVSDYNESKYVFYSVDVTDPFNIILKTNDGHIIKIGDWTNIDYKIAYAISIFKSPSITGLKGYFQLEADGSAVFKKN